MIVLYLMVVNMQIQSIKFFNSVNRGISLSQKTNETQEYSKNTTNSIVPNYNDYLLSFGARIDKSSQAFFERNKDKMPATVKKETIEALERGENITPLELHKRAYGLLAVEDITIDDIKEIYAEDKLFDDLKNIDNMKLVKQGIVREIQIMKDDFKADNLSIFKDAEKNGNDLTLYLLRKFYLEGKTYEEVNKDIHKDIHEIFQKDESHTYIYPSTLKLLGIKLPSREYLHSLFFTREGMEDIQGEKIKQGHAQAKKRFEELPLDEQQQIRDARIARRKMHPLTEEQKAKRNARLSKMASNRWAQMTPEERAEQILKMMIGRENSDSKYQSYAMILTWNNSLDIRDKMSEFFQDKKINIDTLIANTNKTQEDINHLKLFWQANPELGKVFSKRVSDAWNEIRTHIEAGDIDDFTKQIVEKQQDIKFQRQKEIAQQEKLIKENRLFEKQKEVVLAYLATHEGYDFNDVVPEYVLAILQHPLASEAVVERLLGYKNKNLSKAENKQLEKTIIKIRKDVSEQMHRKLTLAHFSTAMFYLLTSKEPFDADLLKKDLTEIVCDLRKQGINPEDYPQQVTKAKEVYEVNNADISDEEAYALTKKISKEKGNKRKPLDPKERRIVAQQVKKLGAISRYIFDEKCVNEYEHEFKRGLFLHVFLKTTIPNWPKGPICFDYELPFNWFQPRVGI